MANVEELRDLLQFVEETAEHQRTVVFQLNAVVLRLRRLISEGLQDA